MRPIPILLTILSLALPAAGQEVAAVSDGRTVTDASAGPGPFPAAGHKLDDFLWVNRLIVVFADTPRDPAFARQMELLGDRLDALSERAIVVLTDTAPDDRTAIRKALRPTGFAIVVVDKDGRVLTRKPSPWDVREITRAVDKTPLRQEEMRDDRALKAQDRGLSD
jgi:Domain of unknown function (DUF4174)